MSQLSKTLVVILTNSCPCDITEEFVGCATPSLEIVATELLNFICRRQGSTERFGEFIKPSYAGKHPKGNGKFRWYWRTDHGVDRPNRRTCLEGYRLRFL